MRISISNSNSTKRMGINSRVFPNVENVRGWHQRQRYQTIETNENGDPNQMKAYCGMCKTEEGAFPVWWGPGCRTSRWRDELGDLVLMKVTEETQLEVEYLAEKCQA
jgi:hypothetical protein